MPHLHQYRTTRQSGGDCCPTPNAPHCITDYTRKKTIEYVDYSEWLPNVRILVPHVADNILLDYIRRACIEFARESRILTRDIEIEPQACIADYYPCLGCEERIDRVRQLSVGGDCYTATGHQCDWRVGRYHYWFHPPNSLVIDPAPGTHKSDKQCRKIVLTVDAVPREDSQQVDRLIHQRHYNAIVDYAAAHAGLVPPDADSAKAAMPVNETYPQRMANFRREIQRAKIDQVRHFSDRPQQWIEPCGRVL